MSRDSSLGVGGGLLHQERVLGGGVLTTPQSTSPTYDLSETSGDHGWKQPPHPRMERLSEVSSCLKLR